jgi:3-oxoadipate enol-lactonase
MRVQEDLKTEKVQMTWGEFSYHRSHGAGRPLVLIHPLALSGRIWELTREEIFQGRQVIAIDVRGHGESRWSGASFTIDDMADDVSELLQMLDIDQCDMAGMSMGGCVTIALAAKRPTLVRRIALCDTTAWYGPNARASWEERAHSAEANSRQALIPFQLDRWFTETFRSEHPSEVKFAVETFIRTDGHAHAQACRALGDFDARSLLDRIESATLVVTGEHDYATPPSMGSYLADNIRGATLAIWSDVRHFAVLESRELRRAIASFLCEDMP